MSFLCYDSPPRSLRLELPPLSISYFEIRIWVLLGKTIRARRCTSFVNIRSIFNDRNRIIQIFFLHMGILSPHVIYILYEQSMISQTPSSFPYKLSKLPLNQLLLANIRLNIPPAKLLAIPPEYMALEARLDAWLNLSHREKARVFVIVRTSAMTADC